MVTFRKRTHALLEIIQFINLDNESLLRVLLKLYHGLDAPHPWIIDSECDIYQAVFYPASAGAR